MLIAGNWKAYVDTVVKAKALVASAKRLALRGKHEIVLAPSAAHLGLFVGTGNKKLKFAAQDVSEVAGGAATGETTATQLANLGVSYVIVGHSERRAAGETDAEIVKKMQQAFAKKLTPILCVGERVRDNDAQYLKELRAQITAVLGPFTVKERATLVIAYEPIWAIGRSALDAITPADLHEMVLYIRKVLSELIPGRSAAKVRILYGGSVEAGNIRDLASAGVDGFLIGHASADPQSFAALIAQLP